MTPPLLHKRLSRTGFIATRYTITGAEPAHTHIGCAITVAIIATTEICTILLLASHDHVITCLLDFVWGPGLTRHVPDRESACTGAGLTNLFEYTGLVLLLKLARSG